MPVFLLSLFAFFGALLMFSVEPLVGKLLLPLFGGGFYVWTTCLMFFQGALFLGYAHCHLIAPRIGAWHFAIVLLGLVSLPIQVHGAPELTHPLTSIVWLMSLAVGLPFCVLATTAVIAQRWLASSRLPQRRNPYHIYAASNAGSLLGLLLYPFLVEPLLSLSAQVQTWSVGYLIYVVVGAATYTVLVRSPAVCQASLPSGSSCLAPADGFDDRPRLAFAELLPVALWFLLSAIPSALLMAVTNVITLDIGSMPLMWVVPLALYLTTFILAFRKHAYSPQLVYRYWPLAALVGFACAGQRVSWWSLFAHLAVLFLLCLVAHTELYRRRPTAGRLTAFYLTIALGGWTGGAFVSIVAPLTMSSLWEYPLAIGAILVLLGPQSWLVQEMRRRISELSDRKVAQLVKAGWHRRWSLVGRLLRRERRPFALVASVLVLTGAAIAWDGLPEGNGKRDRTTLIHVQRNFYGVYRVVEHQQLMVRGEDRVKSTVRSFVHGTTVHGTQIVEPEDARMMPVSYYHRSGPLGDALDGPGHRNSLRSAVIGLGAGAVASYFGNDDELSFYELDPAVTRIAQQHFSYLRDATARRARLRIVHGDARLRLANDPKAPDHHFDVIVIDAFTSDAIPTHLLTREAIQLYLRKLSPEGLMLFNISNRYYDLRPVLKAGGDSLDLHGAYKSTDGDEHQLGFPSTWYALSPDLRALSPFTGKGWQFPADSNRLPIWDAWTDNYASILIPLWHNLTSNR